MLKLYQESKKLTAETWIEALRIAEINRKWARISAKETTNTSPAPVIIHTPKEKLDNPSKKNKGGYC